MARRTAEADKKLFRFAVASGLSLFVLLLTWMTLDLISTSVTIGVASVLTVTGACFATYACAEASRVTRGGLRRSWGLMAPAPILWCLGQLGDSVGMPFIGSLAFAPFALASLVSFAAVPKGAADRARAVLDAFTIGLVLAFIGWMLAGEQLVANYVSPMSVAAPFANVLLLTLAISLLAVVRPTRRLSLVGGSLLTGGVITFVMVEALWFLQGGTDAFASGSAVRILWPLAFYMIGLAATARHSVRRRRTRTSRFPFGQVIPSLAAAMVLTAVLSNLHRSGSLDYVSEWLTSCLVVTVLIRQVVTALEERRLTRLLQEKVADRSAQLNRREQQFKALVQNSSDVTIILRESGELDYVSPSVHYVLGHTPEELMNGSITDLVSVDDRPRVLALLAMAGRRSGVAMTAEWRVMRADGSVRQVEVLVRNLSSEPAVAGIVLNLRDVTERKELEEQLTHQALHDDLTGLANRSLLRQRIEQALARWLFQNEPFALIVVDIKDFKSINDSLGHVAGDNVLKIMAERIQQTIRRGDTLVRLGADEFAVLLERVAADDSVASDMCEAILGAVQQPARIEGRSLALRAHMGMACVTEQVSQSDDIMRNADLALHSAKTFNSSSYVRFESAMHDTALQRVELEADLRRALDNDELQVYYQPTVDMATGKMEGVEALLRWPHPEKGFISPMDFIPIAEESGLIVPIGTWVLEQACNEVQKWQARYPSDSPLTLHVNLSGKQLDQPDIVDVVRYILGNTALTPGSLVLEMTESVLMDNKASTRQKMEELVAAGVELAIDDFGTGYSSLSYLRQFPIKVLKIDRSFVNGVGPGGTQNEAALVQAIIDLARTLELRTVAEGIETGEQLRELQRMGCDVGQGFFMARPASAEDIRRLIASTHAAGLPMPATVF